MPPLPPTPPAQGGNFASGGWNQTPWNPNFPIAQPNFAPQEIVESPNLAPQNFAVNTAPRIERRNKPSELFIAALTGWVLKGYFDNKKFKKQEKTFSAQQAEQNERVNRLQDAHYQLTAAYDSQGRELAETQHASRMTNTAPQPYNQPLQHTPENQLNYAPPIHNQPPPFASEQRPAIQPSGPEAIALPLARPHSPELTAPDQSGEDIDLQPGQHLDREGWYSVVKDDHNRVVQGAINYGEAFKQEQRQEQTPVMQMSSPESRDGIPLLSIPTANLGLNSGQLDMQHELPPGNFQQADQQHMLEPYSDFERQGVVKSAIANPWLWAAVLVWLAVFFVIVLV
jgi:hypothetical protein